MDVTSYKVQQEQSWTGTCLEIILVPTSQNGKFTTHGALLDYSEMSYLIYGAKPVIDKGLLKQNPKGLSYFK